MEFVNDSVLPENYKKNNKKIFNLSYISSGSAASFHSLNLEKENFQNDKEINNTNYNNDYNNVNILNNLNNKTNYENDHKIIFKNQDFEQMDNSNRSNIPNSSRNSANDKYRNRRIFFMTIVLIAIFYFTHLREKANAEEIFGDDKYNTNKNRHFSGCIVEIFSDDIYKMSWKIINANKFSINTLLTVLFYYYDFIFFFSLYCWIINTKKQSWEFAFSLTMLGLFKYFCLEFYREKNNEDIIWKIPYLPFFLTIQNSNAQQNNFFSATTSAFLIIIKQLRNFGFQKLAITSLFVLVLEINVLLLMRQQSPFGVLFGFVFGLYLNSTGLYFSQLLNLFYNFNDQQKSSSSSNRQNNAFIINDSIAVKIRQNVEKILKEQQDKQQGSIVTILEKSSNQ